MLRKTLCLALIFLASCRCEHPKGSYGKDDYSTPSRPMNFGVVFMGNFINADQKKVMEAVKKYCVTNICSIGLMTGNNIDPMKDFEHIMNGSPVKFFGAPGPRDGLSKAKTAHWEMPNRFYAMSGGKVDFYAVAKDMPSGWLDDELKKGDPKWKVAFGFVPTPSKVDFFLHAGKDLVEKDGTVLVGVDASHGFGHLLLTEDSALVKVIGLDGKTKAEKEVKK